MFFSEEDIQMVNRYMKRYVTSLIISSVQFSHSVMPYSLPPHEPQYARPPCPSPSPAVCSNSCPSSRWCHPAMSSSVVPSHSHLQSFPASGSFPMSQFLTLRILRICESQKASDVAFFPTTIKIMNKLKNFRSPFLMLEEIFHRWGRKRKRQILHVKEKSVPLQR